MDTSVLSTADLHYFDKWNFVRVPQALSEAFVEKVRKIIWQNLEAQCGMEETDPSTWRPEWCRINKDKIDEYAGTEITERLSSAISQILGGRQHRPMTTYGGLLMTMPDSKLQVWEAASKGRHFDNDPHSYLNGVDEVMLFIFYSSV